MHQIQQLLALERDKLRIGTRLLTGNVSLKRYSYKLGFAKQRKCRLCVKESENSLYILCYCLTLSCKRYRFWGRMFLEPEDLAEKRVSNLVSLVSNTKQELTNQLLTSGELQRTF